MKQGARGGPTREVGGQADRSEFWDLLSGEPTRRKPSPPSPHVGAGPTPATLPWANPRRQVRGSMRPGGPKPGAPAPLSPPPWPQRRCPAARAPRCRSAPGLWPGPPGGRRGSAPGKEGAAARAACPRPRGRPPAAPGVPAAPPPVSPRPAGRGAGASPAVGRRAGGGGWGRAPPLSFSVPAGRALGSPGRRCPLVSHFGREREDSQALAGRRFLPGHSPVDGDPHPESARPGDLGPTCPLRGTPPSARRDGLTWAGLSARSVRACPPWGRSGELCPCLLHPLMEDESPQSVLYFVYACSHLEGRS
ncbi:unnamed protein product [Rangifer tarandus platyrhynchus]|uniref:Uncharacterized protein n=1 Tax=Rangifer tarandus platyrhynchus TaxID=3082113 RepID=A0ABN8YST7_RANTA|nr:unnamed protein product [Rangifer tarandus platyrhynchus]